MRPIRSLRHAIVAHRLIKRLRQEPDLKGLSHPQVLRCTVEKLTIKAVLGSQQVIIAQMYRGDRARVAENLFTAHQNLHEDMYGTPDYDVPKAIYLVAPLGVFITECVEGTPLSTVLRDRSVSDFSPYVTRAAGWLKALHGSVPARQVIIDIPQLVAEHLGPAEKATELQDVLKSLKTCAAPFAACPRPIVRFHKDFIPGNIIIGPQVTWGIDLTRTRKRLGILDIAFFVVQALRDVAERTAQPNYGVIRAEICNAFQNAYPLTPEDQTVLDILIDCRIAALSATTLRTLKSRRKRRILCDLRDDLIQRRSDH